MPRTSDPLPPPPLASNSQRLVRRRTTYYGSHIPNQPTLRVSQRGVARDLMANPDEGWFFDHSSDIPHPPSLSPDPAQEEYAGEAEMNRQRRKRRRLADIPAFQHLPYGHDGQVVPGPLKLDVVDVNSHESKTCKDARYQARILRRNWNVFSTQTDHCDVILQHKGRVPFSLTKVVIKVPMVSTYRRPISEGLVFVAMKASEFERTVHYRLRSTVPSALRLARFNPLQGVDATQGRGTHIHIHDRPPSRRADNVITHPTFNPHPNYPPPNGWQQLGSHWVRPATRTQRRGSVDSGSPQRVLSPPIPDSEFQVRVTPDDPPSASEHMSADESELSTASGPPSPDRRSRARSDTPRPSFSPTSSAEGSEDELDELDEHNARMDAIIHQHLPLGAGTLADDPTMPVLIDHPTTDPGAYVSNNSRRRRLRLNKEGESVWGMEAKSEKELEESSALHPHARFFFEKGKTRVSVKFDPPVSGKLILLKLWSKKEDQTIDIQNITAYGYVGQRFFPSEQAQ